MSFSLQQDTIYMEEENKQDQSNNRPWLYKKGQSGNPAGRPPGSKSMKTYVKEKLAAMTEEEREEFLEGVDKKILWEMAEGKPKQDIQADVEIAKKIISVDE